MIHRAVVRAVLKPRDDGSFEVVGITGENRDGHKIIDDDGWVLRPGYRLSVSLDLVNEGGVIKASFSRRRIRRKYRPPSESLEDGTSSSLEEVV